ncbi:glycosyltransferase family 4 protein [Candidatus Formimonas warabiya]|nr:glycosyltransferase family 4 protein [Candidatus Formimonas warabiya]
MNILHVVRPAEGGMKNHVLSLLKHLDKEKYHFVLCCPDGEEWGSLLSGTGVQVRECPLKGEISPWSDVHSILKLVNMIKSLNIDVVHTHGMKAGLVGRIAGQLVRSSGKIGGGHRPFASPGPYLISTVHNSIYQYALPEYQKRFLSTLQKYLARQTDKFVTVSQALKTEIMAWEGIQEKNIEVIYNGIPVDSFTKKSSPYLKIRLGLNPITPVVGTVARLAPQKGVEFFVQAAFLVSQIIDTVQFLVVGEGPLKKELQRQAERLGLRGKIIFTGHYADVSEIYPLMDVFAVPSLSEGLSITTIEAMAAQRPIVASAAGGIPELISHRQTGFLVPPGDHQALAHGILELLKRPKWSEKLAKAARQKAQAQFTIEQMVRQTDDLYQQIAGGREIAGFQRRYAHA